MSSVRKFAISLPTDIADAVEKSRAARGQSRSDFIREAVQAVLRAERERDDVVRYIRGYEEFPETEEEGLGGGMFWSEILKEYPWDEEG